MEKKQSFPFDLTLNKIKYVPPKMSDQLTIFFVLRGSMTILIGEKKYIVKSDDLFVINPFEYYQIESLNENLILVMQIDRRPITSHFKENWLPQIDNSALTNEEQTSEKVQEIRELLVHLMVVYFKKNETNELEIYQYFFSLLDCLVKSFKKNKPFIPIIEMEDVDDWMAKILESIEKEYDQQVSLETLAIKYKVSYYHLSRSFKKQVGMTFTEYVNQIRLDHAIEELILSTNPIVKVALNNGFSTIKSFHQVFKKYYDMTPSVYRKKYSLVHQQSQQVPESTDYQEIKDSAVLQELAKYLINTDIENESVILNQQLSLVIPEEPQMAYKKSKKIIKIGPASEGLADCVQRELCILQKKLEFDLVQFEGFCDETNFDNDLFMISEYLLNNHWFDFLVKIKLRPMIQLRLPEIYTCEKEVTLWCDRQLELIRHFVNRYGRIEVNQWYIQWEVHSNENNRQALESFAYQYLYRKIKQLVPKCKVGLLAIRSLAKEEYNSYKEFIYNQYRLKFLPDFISFHADPYASPVIKERYAVRFKEYQKKMLSQVESVIEEVQNELSWHPEVFLTDWNTLVGEGNTFSGTFFRSALILESVIEVSREVAGIAFWLNIKVKERITQTREENSLSVFLYEELRRPLFFSLGFLMHIKGELVAQGNGYVLTRNNEEYQLLLYNSSYLDPKYSVDAFQVQYQTKNIHLFIKNLPEGEYNVREYTLDKDHGGIYNDWMRVGGQVEIDQELQQYLEHKIMPKFELSEKTIISSGYNLRTTLTINACKLFLFQPKY